MPKIGQDINMEICPMNHSIFTWCGQNNLITLPVGNKQTNLASGHVVPPNPTHLASGQLRQTRQQTRSRNARQAHTLKYYDNADDKDNFKDEEAAKDKNLGTMM